MRAWRKPYSREAALTCGIHRHEHAKVTGAPDARWIYFVEVVDFRFAFFSLEMLDRYIDFFGRKILPSTRSYGSSPFTEGPALFPGGGQSPFERLPARLRKKNVRPKVLKALQQAKAQFEAEGDQP